MPNILSPGTKAPDFSLQENAEKMTSLKDFKGRLVILAFYPADFTPVCGDQLVLYNEILSEFDKYNAQLLGISVDSIWCHAAFAKERHIEFPLLADFEPKGAVSKAYGAYESKLGMSERALFVIDKEGTIAWSYLSPKSENPGADGILEALHALSTKEGLYVSSSNHK